MNIHFGLHLSPNAYIDLQKRDGIMYDECVINLDGLVQLLSLHLGIHLDDMSQVDRQAAYYEAFSTVEDKKSLAKSWEQNSLGVSNECLKWRDALVACGWTPLMNQPSSRLQVLAEVEKHFNAPCIADYLNTLLPILKKKNPLPQNSTIYIAAASIEDLPPLVSDVLTCLASKGTTLKFEENKAIAPEGSNLANVQRLILNSDKRELNSSDDSLEIWDFPTSIDAYRYISSRTDKESLYICSDTKIMDNVQRMMGQATSGSKMSDSHPQIAQLFKLGITLFEYPFNIRNLVSWLMMPNHPIPYELRHALAQVVVSKGGYNNEKYEEVISNYKDKVAEEEGRRQDAKINKLINTFIPIPEKDGVNKDSLCNFLVSLGDWCNKMLNVDGFSDVKKAQFAKVKGLCNALWSIVHNTATDIIPYRQLESWASSLYAATDFALYDMQAGSRWACNAYDIVDQVDSIIWTDCYNYSSPTLSTEFLNATEHDALQLCGCKFWDNNLFNLTAMHDAMRPVLMAKKRLVIVTANQNNIEPTAKHPLIIRLEEAYGDTFKSLVKHPACSDVETCEVTKVENDHRDTHINFSKNNLVCMPDHESYSALENLIQYPLDYFMEKVLRLRDRASYQLDDIETVKGNVAHRVVELFFKDASLANNSHLNERYDNLFSQAIDECGAVLLLKENLIELKLFRGQLKENLEVLLDIITKNNLEVVGTEREVNLKIGLLDNDEKDPPVKGYVDMLLRRKSDGNIVIFDLKWTSSRTKHKQLLEENTSIQLALYERLISTDMDKKVVATAYYTMPVHKLYTTSKNLVDMNNVEHITPVNDDNLIEKIINSYRYRLQEFLGGTIATEEGYPMSDELAYVANTEGKNLLPLKEYQGVVSTNLYSNFNCFKGSLK